MTNSQLSGQVSREIIALPSQPRQITELPSVQQFAQREYSGRFLSGGIILGSPLSCTDLFLYTITLPAASCDAPPTLSYTTLELASRVLLSTKKPAFTLPYQQQSLTLKGIVQRILRGVNTKLK
jgi:hypothetical protein